ncbi:MAG: trans-sulfuration enzyme family protein [Candidatus Planktophila sp.]
MSHDLSSEKPSTRAITAGRPVRQADSELNASISLNSTFTAGGPIGYGRYGNQTWSQTESAIAALEGGRTLIFSSGMAAISAALSILPLGSTVVASNQGYSGVMTLLNELHASKRLVVKFVDIAKTDEVLAALPGADLLWLESPTNPCLDVAELPALISAARAAKILVMVDNTFATALTQRPLEMGADVVMNSVTKFLAGHSDIVMGSLSTNDEVIAKKLEDSRKFNGSIPGPFEAWLALRGIRTFPLRFMKSCESALELARRLESHPKVSRVRYPGLPSDSQHGRATSFMNTFGAVLSFEITGSAADADRVCDSSTIITHATSLGGVESLWERRRRWPIESSSVPETLIRLSVGCEDVDDLWADIQRALTAI